MSCHDKEELVGLLSVRDEESPCALNMWGQFCADGETKGCGERLTDPSGGVGGGDRLVHLGTGGTEQQ